jgi:putative salt-induced outer membrane protein YdiY
MMRLIATLLLTFVLSSSLAADQLVMKNGDRLSGTIVKSDDKNLVIKNDYAGEITVQWSAVQEMNSAAPLHVGLKNGQTLVGPVTSENGNLAVATTTGKVEASKDSVSIIRNQAEQTAYDKSLHPGWSQNWTGGANVGFALTRGNSETRNLSLAFNANRTTLRDKLSLYANSVFAANDVPGANPKTSANAKQGGIRYDHDITHRLFGFVSGDFQSDALQTLNLRSVFGGGLGFHVVKREATTLDLLAGANYTHESYDAFSRNLAAVTIGEEFMHKLHKSTVLTQTFYFYPDLSETGEYRGTFNFGTVTRISKWLGWQNSFGDIYVSNPPTGKKQNDVLLTTGLNVTFTH